MRSFTSFLDLAGDPELAADLEGFYEDIEAVEYYVGKCLCLSEGRGDGGGAGVYNFSLKYIFFPQLWIIIVSLCSRSRHRTSWSLRHPPHHGQHRRSLECEGAAS